MQVFDSYIDAGQELPQRERERFYCALVEFAAYGKEPELKGAAGAVMTAIMPSLRISRKNAENGRKGGKQKAKRRAKSLDDSLGSETASESQANVEANSNSKELSDNPVRGYSDNSGKRITCPQCGAEAEHLGGSVYACSACEPFGITFEARA